MTSSGDSHGDSPSPFQENIWLLHFHLSGRQLETLRDVEMGPVQAVGAQFPSLWHTQLRTSQKRWLGALSTRKLAF